MTDTTPRSAASGLNRLGAAAEAYARKGWHVFPLKPGGKEPATRSGLHAATVDAIQIRRWWRQDEYNVGIVAGPSNLVFVDLDLHEVVLERRRDYSIAEEVPGICSWNALLDHFDLEWIETTTVVTPRGGLHLYFRAPPKVEIRPSVGVLGPGIDVRAAESYVVAPPSIIGGRRYEVAVKGPLVALPDKLVELFKKPERSEVEDAANRLLMAQRTYMYDDPAFGDFIRRSCDRLRETAVVGSRNDTFNAIAYHVFNVVGSTKHANDAEWELRSAALEIGLTEKEIDKTMRSVRRTVWA